MTAAPSIVLNNGVDVPQLGIGAWQVGDDTIEDVVVAALQIGYRHVDTAAAYGNERGVARGLEDAGVPREDVFVTTKLGNDSHGYDNALAALDTSLGRLGTDYVDLFLINWPLPHLGLGADTWRALEQAYADGRARAIGVSNFTERHLDDLARTWEVVPAVNQIEIHPTFTQEALRATCEERGIVVEAYSPLGRGQDLVEPLVQEIARRTRATPAQVVLAWHLALGHVVFPKTVRAERLVENLAALDLVLDREDLERLSALDRGNRTGPDPDTFV
ncbi:aldo/keto reductase [Mumia sp. DW29H23]|uniref:aldo/keto reductase n=1 Tax=Mumia sp. DW29H23 TaxID=3421241 RepID=UPI003D69206E